MFEIALNKCTVLLSTTGLEENIPTIEALIWAQRAVPQQPRQILPPVSRLEALWASTPCWTRAAQPEPERRPLFALLIWMVKLLISDMTMIFKTYKTASGLSAFLWLLFVNVRQL